MKKRDLFTPLNHLSHKATSFDALSWDKMQWTNTK